MIEIFQGTMGSGKSSCAVVNMAEFLLDGGVVATNFPLLDGWAMRLASMNFLCKLGLKSPVKRARDLYSRAFYAGTPDTLYRVSKDIKHLVNGQVKKQREGRARLYFDEAHFYFNSRNWQKNMGFIEFFSQSRKLGWDIILIAHSMEMIDKQVRPLIEIETRLRNLQNIKMLGFIKPPFPVFVSNSRYAGMGPGAGAVVGMPRFYLLRKEYAELYDSMHVFAFDNLSDQIKGHGKQPGGTSSGNQVEWSGLPSPFDPSPREVPYQIP